MKKKEFCNEIINQVNYILGEENKRVKLSESRTAIINYLTAALANYCVDFEEYHNYISKIKNQIGYYMLSYKSIIDMFED